MHSPINVIATYGMPMIVSRTRITAVLAGGAAVVLIAGCSSNKPGKVVTVTVPPPAATAATTPAPGSGSPPSVGSPATGSTAPTGTAAPGTTAQAKLPGTCDSLLPDYVVARAVGKGALPGKDEFVVGLPESDIHRLGYINCQYGVTGSGAKTASQLEIGVSLYSSADDAAERISATVDDYTNHGAQTQDVKVAGLPATLLTGGTGDGYSEPLLVIASDQRTVAVTVTKAVATGAAAATSATKLAELALTKTAP